MNEVPKRMNPACCVSRKSLPFYYLIADMKGREDSRGDIPSYLYSLPLGLSEWKERQGMTGDHIPLFPLSFHLPLFSSSR